MQQHDGTCLYTHCSGGRVWSHTLYRSSSRPAKAMQHGLFSKQNKTKNKNKNLTVLNASLFQLWNQFPLHSGGTDLADFLYLYFLYHNCHSFTICFHDDIIIGAILFINILFSSKLFQDYLVFKLLYLAMSDFWNLKTFNIQTDQWAWG